MDKHIKKLLSSLAFTMAVILLVSCSSTGKSSDETPNLLGSYSYMNNAEFWMILKVL